MATKTYTQIGLPLQSGRLSKSGITGLLDNYQTTYTITSTVDAEVWIKSADSPSSSTWTTVYPSDGTYQLGKGDPHELILLYGGYHQVWVTPIEESVTGTVDISISAVSLVTTYCQPSDVSDIMGLRDIFGDTSSPTESQVKKLILHCEDELDKKTGHAWRAVMATNEYHDFTPPRFYPAYSKASDERSIALNHRSIRQFSSGSHKLEVAESDAWNDFVANKTEGRANDYWVDYTNGIVYFKASYPYKHSNALRATYEYGESSVPYSITKLCALMVSKRLLMMDDYQVVVPEGFMGMTTKDKIQIIDEEIKQLLEEFKELDKGW